jgi:hypothetical protein
MPVFANVILVKLVPLVTTVTPLERSTVLNIIA